eukprot:TRINITY_DN90710_c0_g1_i1.p1 TRINITY_DN90710_c0_g1~~TRINITY_DN90710_c0_g1_i1.p1  ORF type:complete len:869 (+),score=254.80 TRINITY_DN90710_c0_g1_i1:108-2714(+)
MASATPDDATVCGRLGEDSRRLCRDIQQRWRKAEQRVEAAEEEVFSEHGEHLKACFGAAVLEDMDKNGLRDKIRDRVQKLVLSPLLEDIRLKASASQDLLAGGCAETQDSDPVAALLEEWAQRLEPQLKEANEADEKLTRKVRRLEKRGSERDALLEEVKGSRSIWLPMKDRLETFLAKAKEMHELLTEKLKDEALEALAKTVPAVVGRAICDWHFQFCSAELEQLDSWWKNARAALQRRPALWDKLLQEEGLLARRIDRGIEEITAERWKYAALATFGASKACGEPSLRAVAKPSGGDWPKESITLLAAAVAGMRKRLRPIRDSAAWRVMDAAKALQKAMLAEKKTQERGAWECATVTAGVAALCQALKVATPTSAQLQQQMLPDEVLSLEEGADLSDVALRCMQRLDTMVEIIAADLKDLPDSEGVPDTGGLFYIFEEVMQGLSYLSEELLVVLDEPTEECLGSWTQQWMKWGEEIGGQRLEAAMSSLPLRATAQLPVKLREARQRRLALMRGVQMVLGKPSFRRWLLAAPAASEVASSSSQPAAPAAATGSAAAGDSGDELAVLCLEEPPIPAGVPAAVPTVAATRQEPAPGHAEAESSARQPPHANLPGKVVPEVAVEELPPRPSTAAAIEALGDAPLSSLLAESSTWQELKKAAVAAASGPSVLEEEYRCAKVVRTSPPPPAEAASATPVKAPRDVAATPRLSNASGVEFQKMKKDAAMFEASLLGHGPSSSSSSSASPSTACPSGAASSSSMSRPMTGCDSLSSGLSRPVTPSWLEPPWKRPDASTLMSFGSFNSRPGTPSTVCDDADLRRTSSDLAKFKCVDGHFVPLRKGSCSRLPPLEAPLAAMSPSKARLKSPAKCRR